MLFSRTIYYCTTSKKPQHEVPSIATKLVANWPAENVHLAASDPLPPPLSLNASANEAMSIMVGESRLKLAFAGDPALQEEESSGNRFEVVPGLVL